MPQWIALALLAAIVAACLFGISRIRNRTFHERGHFIFSLLPWAHLLFTYTLAFYVRIGFGAWPQCCFDNPDLPMLDGFVQAMIFGLIIIPLGTPLWLGWLLIRFRRRMNRFRIAATALFVTGIVLMMASQISDPWGFWNWVWD